MYFLPVLECKSCHRTIWLPPPIESRTAPSRSPWRWGDGPQNVACLSCGTVFEYEAADCRWDQLRSRQMENTEEMAAHLLTVPCGKEQCEGLIQILVMAKRGLPPAEGTA